MTMSILVTGGSGFIGSHLVEALLHQGLVVRILDNFTTGHRENLAAVVDRAPIRRNFTCIEGDVTDRAVVREAVRGTDFILHQAALPSVQRSIEDPLTSNQVNVEGTLNILAAARDMGVKRVVYASSSSVYGDSASLPKIESMATHPLSPYAVSKLAAEDYCRAFTHVYRLETVALRYFNVFGPRQDPGSLYAAVIPKFIEAVLEHKSPIIYGDGTQSRDFTFVENVVQANLLALEAVGVAGEVFNIACGKGIDLHQVLDTLAKCSDHGMQSPEYRAPRAGDVKHSLAEISKAERMLGYRPSVHFHEGLKQTFAYFCQRRVER